MNYFKIFLAKKNDILLVFQIRRTPFDQSSPLQPVSDLRGGGPLSVTKNKRTKILVSNIV